MRRRSLKTQVEKVLSMLPETRDSDVCLMIELWKRYYPKYVKTGKNGEQGVWLKDLYELPREDHIKRYRAHFQNDLNMYLPTTLEIAKQRKISEERWRYGMASAFKEKL